jgi:hypothetical protein
MQERATNPIIVKIGFILLILFFFCLSLIKSHTIPMTHDESFNYLGMIDQSMWHCLFSQDCWNTANNHLLNTTFFQWTTQLFGHHAWAVRLPNVLAHLVYMLFAWLIIQRSSNNRVVQLAGFAFFVCNPYLNDFFAVARGYGLSIAFILGCFYFLIRFLESRNSWDLFWCYILVTLSSFSVFTMLIFIPLIWFVTFVIPPIFSAERLNWKRHWIQQTIPFTIIGLMSILVYTPLSALFKNAEFSWGIGSLYDSYLKLVTDSLYGDQVIGDYTYELFLALAIIAVITSTYVLFRKSKISINRGNFKGHLGIILIFLLLNIALVAQHHILGSQYPEGRKSVLYLPILNLVCLYGLIGIKGRPGRIISIIILLFSAYHTYRHTHLDSCREWYFDEHTTQMLNYLEEKKDEDQKIDLALSWYFYPSVHFYKQIDSLDWLKKIGYHKAVDKNKVHDYYYVTREDAKELRNTYALDMEFGSCCLLLKKKASK